MLRQRFSDSVPSASSIGVGLVKNRNPLSADKYKVVDQSFDLLVIRGPQIKNILAVRWLPKSLRPRERRKEVDRLTIVTLKERENSRYRGSADIIEKKKCVVRLHEFDGALNRGNGIVTIVIGFDDDLAAVNSAASIDMLDVGHRAPVKFYTKVFRGSGKCRGHADHDVFGKQFSGNKQ